MFSAKMLSRSSKLLSSYSFVPRNTQLVLSKLTWTWVFLNSAPIKSPYKCLNFFTNQMKPLAPKSVPSILCVISSSVNADDPNLSISFYLLRFHSILLILSQYEVFVKQYLKKVVKCWSTLSNSISMSSRVKTRLVMSVSLHIKDISISAFLKLRFSNYMLLCNKDLYPLHSHWSFGSFLLSIFSSRHWMHPALFGLTLL